MPVDIKLAFKYKKNTYKMIKGKINEFKKDNFYFSIVLY